MSSRCCVPNCNSEGKWNRIMKLHHMPNNEKVRAKWLTAFNILEKDLPKRPRVCSRHFVESDYTVTKFNYSLSSKNNPSPSKNACEFKALKPNAVPSLFLPGKSSIKIKISKRDKDNGIKVEQVKQDNEKTKSSCPKKNASSTNDQPSSGIPPTIINLTPF